MANPLLTKTFVIPFDRITAAHVEPAVSSLVAEAQRRIDEIADQDDVPTYATTLGALEEATEDLEWASTVIGHLESVATYPEFRKAYEAVQPILTRFWSGIPLNAKLWQVLCAFAETEEAGQLDGVRRRYLKKVLDDFRREGADLDDAGKETVTAYNVELAELTTKFSQNVLDSTNAFELIVTDEDQLAGLPPSAREFARENAVAKGTDGWRFTLQAPSYVPIMTYLDDDAVRRRVWTAQNTRATEPRFDNLGIVARILELRRLKAELLGFRDFADLVLADRMAESGERAHEFVHDLRDRTLPFFERENESLAAFRSRVDGASGLLQPWDIAYFAEKQRKAEFDFDEEQLRPYFPVDRVLEGLFGTIARLYGVSIAPTKDLPVWDPSVRTYRLLDHGGEHLASFYLDLYPRENKRDGAWMNGLILGAPPKPHLALFCANANPPVGNKPALFTHREVEIFYHEFGHLIHHCFSRVPVRSLGGTNVAWDFVELPSQIMENWCWEREALDLFARHYETGDPIPEDLFARMKRARTFRAANAQMRQLGFADLDLALHRNYDPSAGLDLVRFTRQILDQYSPAPLPEEFAFVTSFSHLFSNPVGYAAGYYSYKWAEVLDADAFTRFRDTGVFNAATGAEFRRTILERGDSEEPMDLYRAFMGREPRLEALLEREGLSASRASATP